MIPTPTPNNPDHGYNGNPRVKKDGVDQVYTQYELDEYIKCSQDPVYFIENYVKVISLDKGLTQFKLYGYQRKMVEHFNNNRFSIVLACRQSGKSVTSIAWLLWFVLFHGEKQVGILANKGATAREMLSRLTLMLENIPFFLQPGCQELNKGSIKFSNNSKIIAAATSSSSIRGLSLNVIMLDEFAFVNDASTFYTSTYPVISSGTETKVIITSTPNGIGNMFYRLWEKAVQGTNEFKPFTIKWWDVPGRDEAWKAQTIANTSELQFSQEFEVSFIGSANTLIASDVLLGLQAGTPQRLYQQVRIYEESEPGKTYAMMVDVSKGRGQDFSTFTVIETSTTPFRQVAVFKDNLISPLLFPDIIVRLAKMYNNALVLIENNDAGQIVCNSVYHEYEYENTFVSSSVKASGIGVTMTKRVKRIGCSNLKDLIESGKLQICDVDTISELSSFEAKGGSYEAGGNAHDDLVMNLVLFAWFVSTDIFKDTSDVDLRNLLYSDRLKEMEDDVVPFGIITNSREMANQDAYDSIIAANKEWNML
jgi:hypothetical protein